MRSGLKAAAVVLTLFAAPAARAQPALNFTAPAVANPASTLLANGATNMAITLSLSNAGAWSNALALTLNAQGFTAANNWVYAANGNPGNQVNPVAMTADSSYNVTEYSTNATVGERITFSVNFGTTAQPAGATLHWLQLLHEDQKYNNFGFVIGALPGGGIWKLDNGSTNGGPATGAPVNGFGPYYDSNNPGGGLSVPLNFFDAPSNFPSAVGTYFEAWTIPVWDVSNGGKDYIIVGDTAVHWGFVVVPEPPPAVLGLVALLAACAVTRLRRRAA